MGKIKNLLVGVTILSVGFLGSKFIYDYSNVEYVYKDIDNMDKKEYINSCSEIDYRDTMKNIDKHKGKRVVVEVGVSEILTNNVYIANDKKEGKWLGNGYMINDTRSVKTKVYKNDIIRVYGEIKGINRHKAVMDGLVRDKLEIDMKYLELKGETDDYRKYGN